MSFVTHIMRFWQR